MARPTRRESRQRAGQFLLLVAQGVDIVQARKQAGIDSDRALRIVGESSFAQIIDTLRAGLAQG